MKATLFVIENDVDHAQAKALIEKLMGSNDPADRARLTAQARLVEAYERARWPRRAPSLPDLLTFLMDQHGLSRADLAQCVCTEINGNNPHIASSNQNANLSPFSPSPGGVTERRRSWQFA
jgi:antitoxin component HigA of HigAB toxin-antitoxin module